MKLCVKLATGLKIPIEGQIDDPLGICEEELIQIDLVFADIVVEVDEGGEDVSIADGGPCEGP